MKILLDWRTYIIGIIILAFIFITIYLNLYIKENSIGDELKNKDLNVKENTIIKEEEKVDINFNLKLGDSLSIIENELRKINELEIEKLNDVTKNKIITYKNELEKIDTLEEQKKLLKDEYVKKYGELNSDSIELEFKNRYDLMLPNNYIFDNSIVSVNYKLNSINKKIENLIKNELINIENEKSFTKKDYTIKFVYINDIETNSDGIFYKYVDNSDYYTSFLVDVDNDTIYMSGLYINEDYYISRLKQSINFLVNYKLKGTENGLVDFNDNVLFYKEHELKEVIL